MILRVGPILFEECCQVKNSRGRRSGRVQQARATGLFRFPRDLSSKDLDEFVGERLAKIAGIGLLSNYLLVFCLFHRHENR